MADLPPVFVTGSTGYIGQPLIRLLLSRGYAVRGLVRPGSEARLPPGAQIVIGKALDASTFARAIPAGATVIHLVGTPHPNPSKAAEFERVDLASIRATVVAAQEARAAHLIYVSVAHPAPIMRAYIAARREGEAVVSASGIRATIVRPWYVLGPGHLWPYALVPIYGVLRLLPSTRATAERLGLVTLQQMVSTLAAAVATVPSTSPRIIDVAGIRAEAQAAR
jgi:uncharacterized protein YbjT (DUF2867 family)